MENTELENVVSIKKDKTEEEKLQGFQKEASDLFYATGQLQYQIDCLKGDLADLNIKLRNANVAGSKIQKKLMDERASKLTVEEKKNE